MRAPVTSVGLPSARSALGAHRELWFVRISAALRMSPTVLVVLTGVAVAGLTPVVVAFSAPIAYERRPFEPFIPYLMSVGTPIAAWCFARTIRWAERALTESRRNLLGQSVQAGGQTEIRD